MKLECIAEKLKECVHLANRITSKNKNINVDLFLDFISG